MLRRSPRRMCFASSNRFGMLSLRQQIVFAAGSKACLIGAKFANIERAPTQPCARSSYSSLPPGRKRRRPASPCPTLAGNPRVHAGVAVEHIISARALEFTILTAPRTSESTLATWEELDLDEQIWRVPAPRMKAFVAHRVPLSSPACDLLDRLPQVESCAYVFPGARAGRALSNMAMLGAGARVASRSDGSWFPIEFSRLGIRGDGLLA